MKLNIQKLAKDQNISIPKLAERAGIHYRTLNEITRQNSGNIKTLVKIADSLGVPVDELIERESDTRKMSNGNTVENNIIPMPNGHQYSHALDEHYYSSNDKPIEAMSDADIRQKHELVRQRKPQLANKVHRVAEKTLPEILFLQEQAFVLEEKEEAHAALQSIERAFLRANHNEVKYIDPKAIALLLDLCKKLHEKRTIHTIIEKYTSPSYVQTQFVAAMLAIFAEKMSYNYDDFFDDELGFLYSALDSQLVKEV